MNATSAHLAAEADRLARSGRLQEAAACFRRLLTIDPEHVGALSFLGLMAFRENRLDESAELIGRALAVAPEAATLHLNLALIHRRRGDLETCLDCLLQAALTEPKNAMVHFQRGSALAARGQLAEASKAFALAFELAPNLAGLRRPEDAPPQFRELVREAHAVQRKTLHTAHWHAVAPLRAQHGDAALERIDAFLRIHHGEAPLAYENPRQRPNYIYVPGVPAQPWFERDEFGWIEHVEAAFTDVHAELLTALDQRERLRPYVDATTGAPREWDHLTDKTTWSSFHLLKGGEPVPENVALCPRTNEMLAEVPLVRCQGNSPEAFFSILQPGVDIPPHVGLANFKLAVHLALIIPEGCAIEVGGERRGWEEGRCLIFDDSFEHSAWNHGSRDRTVLIFEVWNPLLTEIEREAIAAVIRTSDNFHREMAAQTPA